MYSLELTSLDVVAIQMSTSDSDDVPLFKRATKARKKVLTGAAKLLGIAQELDILSLHQTAHQNFPGMQDDVDRRSNSGSPLPEWLSQNTSPVNTLELLSDSDEVMEVASGDDGAEEKHEVGPESAASREQAAKKHRAAPRGRGGRRVNRVLLSSENDDSGDEGSAGEEQPSARKRQKTVPATQLSQKSPSQNVAGLLKKHKVEDSAVGNGSASQQTLQKIPEGAEQVNRPRHELQICWWYM